MQGLYNQQGQLMLKNLTLPELEEWCESVGEPPKRAKQLMKAMYGSGKWVADLSQVDTLDPPATFSAAFKAKVCLYCVTGYNGGI